jgi:hypothetical protein
MMHGVNRLKIPCSLMRKPGYHSQYGDYIKGWKIRGLNSGWAKGFLFPPFQPGSVAHLDREFYPGGQAVDEYS